MSQIFAGRVRLRECTPSASIRKGIYSLAALQMAVLRYSLERELSYTPWGIDREKTAELNLLGLQLQARTILYSLLLILVLVCIFSVESVVNEFVFLILLKIWC